MKLASVIGAGAVMAAVAVTLPGRGVSAEQAKPAAAVKGGGDVPQFRYDKTFPKPLPNVMKVGQVVGVAVDSRNHVWIVQRPKSLKGSETEAADGRYGGFTGSIAGCCRPALPVLEFDQTGNMVQTWGGPQDLAKGYDWPTPGAKSPDSFYGSGPFGERGIFVDHNDNVWLGADGPGDGFILKVSRFGRPLLQIGKKGQSKGSHDTANLNGASGIVVDAQTNEVFVADGLKNRRVIVFNGLTGKYLRHWGAYGKPPDDLVQMKPDSPDVNSPQFGDVHCIAMSRDKLVYVCDRVNNRIQVFRQDGTFVKQGVVAPATPGGTTYGIAFSPDPEQRFAYVADGTNEKVWILNRDTLETVGSFGSGGHFGGQFTTAHSIATDQQGNIYVGETWEGKRVQRFRYLGQGPAAR
ncbi:MAG: hypothetical protein ABL971_05680 [Vicinamibacterales bacterium]